MKKCEGCEKEIDKYGIVCEYCGKLSNKEAEGTNSSSPTEQPSSGSDKESN